MGQEKLAHRSARDRGTPPPADGLFVLTAILVLAAAVLGGASRENPLRLAAVELCAVAAGGLAIRRMAEGSEDPERSDAAPLVIMALILAVPLLQLIPLPPGSWTRLPGQAPRLEALTLAGLPTPWLPMTLAPAETRRAALALIPPAAMFLASLRLSPGQARRLGWLWIAMAGVGLALGAVQMATPAGGPAYLYATTNLGSLVGLFANRNHEAGFLLALLPFAAALALPPARGPGDGGSKSGAAPWLAGLFVLISVVALGVIRSRAGVILAAPAVIAALLVLWRCARGRLGLGPLIGVAAAAALASVAVAAFSLTPILQRFDRQAVGEFRFQAWPYVAAAARPFLPLGSGVGSFDRVFQSVEPLDLVAPAYFNHAHDEALEVWLETGWIGVGVLGLFCVWLAAATWRAWRTGNPLACAASAAVLLLMAQSLVDYPLRTETLAVLAAFCCGLLARRGPSLG